MEHDQNIVKIVFCLSMDLISSTKTGLKLSTQNLDKFNIALVNQIKPHLEKLDLNNVLIKFTGDGWILMTDQPEKVPALCCFATIMANRFQEEMSKTTGIAIDHIPSLRLAICFGRDIYIKLPDGRKDWVGDSARRATRASGFCYPNEIIIDETVRGIVFRDFDINIVDVKQRPPPLKMEEELTLYGLEDPKIANAADSEAPEYFVYTLSAIGKLEDAEKVAQQVSERLENEAGKVVTAKGDIASRILLDLNKVIVNLPDFSATLKILNGIKAVKFNVFTYNILIKKSPDYETAKEWFERMLDENILPDIFTYNTLINKVSDYETAKEWFDWMQSGEILPDAITYSTLIKKSTDYEIAEDLFEKMQEEGILPDVSTYSTLINKAPDFETAKDLIEEMRKDGKFPDIGTFRTLHMLIEKTQVPDYKAAKAWVNKKRIEGNYNLLINNSFDHKSAKVLMGKMRKEGILPDVITYNIIINKAPNFETAKALMREMRKEGIVPDVVTYNTILKKALDFKTGKTLMDKMRKEGIVPDVITYKTLNKLNNAEKNR